MLKSERVILRAVEPKDVEYLFEAENDVKIWNLSSTLIPFSRRTLSDYANSIHDLTTQKQFRFIIEQKVSKKVIGMIDLFDYDAINQRAGVGIVISDLNERNNGYASESLNAIIDYSRKTLHLNQLYCSIHATNAESILLFQKLGFIQTGIRKDWFKVANEKWEDEIEFQLLLASKK
jgi:diamine N-acetyltransferase